MPHDVPNELVVGPKEPGNEAFGILMQQFRVQLGLTRAQAAERLGFTSEYLRLIERGKRTPAFENMPLIFGVYDVPFVTDGKKQFIIEDMSIQFNSRTRSYNRDGDAYETPEIIRDSNRANQIGQIIELLVQADERKLNAVHRLLRRT